LSALCLCLGQPADVFLIDEPSAYLDSEQRITAAKIIKRYVLHTKKTAFIVEHDFIMATYMADKVVVCVPAPRHQCCHQCQLFQQQHLVNGLLQ
jgi:ATP-binding cassette subfamily E protein 1